MPDYGDEFHQACQKSKSPTLKFGRSLCTPFIGYSDL